MVTRNPSLERATDYMWRNARLLERSVLAHKFLDGPAEAVSAALIAYRNPDGGFGNALEPDVRAPGSMPLHCEFALRVLCEAEIRDAQLATRMCEYLASIAEPDGRVEVTTPALELYPRAAHWTHSSRGDSPNPTAGIAGLLRYHRIEHPWLKRAIQWCERRLERPIEEAHELACAIRFFEYSSDRSSHDAAVRIARTANRARWFRADPSSTEYGVTPLQLCPTPESIARPAFSDALIAAHLDALAQGQQDDGGWPITWTAPSPAAELEWRGRITLEAIMCLRAWNRL